MTSWSNCSIIYTLHNERNRKLNTAMSCVEFAFLVWGTSTTIAIWMIPTRSLLDVTIHSLLLNKDFKCLANEDTNSEVPTVSAIKGAD